MKKIKRILPIVIGSAIVVSSCNNGGEKKEEVSSTQTETVDTLAQDEQTFNYVLPSPVQIASIFYRAKLKFEDGLMNKPENSAKYNTETKRTLNIGVYSTDLAYCLLNSQTQLSLNYLKTTRDLSDKIGMGSIYNAESLVERFQKNISNIDSLSEILSTIQIESKSFLEDNDRRFSALNIFTGAWVEAIFIATKSIENNFNEKIMRAVAEQHVSLSNLINLLKQHEESKQPEFNDVLAKLIEINTLLENCADYKAQPLEEGEVMPLSFTLTQQETKALGEKVAQLRNLITN